ncbi:MAG: UDP-N-acetylmuramate dehydrogenase [Candidatus Tectimicrobiota bacterium]
MATAAHTDVHATALFRRLEAEGRGQLTVGEAMAPHTTFRIGGPVDLFYVPADREDLAAVVRLCHELGEGYFVVGGGSNLVVRDGGIRGLVIHLAPALRRCWLVERTEDDGVLAAEAGVATSTLVATAARASLTGLEFAVAIPGTVGGALRMNAGTPEGEVGDRAIGVEVVTGAGGLRWFAPTECGFAYRQTAFPPEAIIVEGRWRLPVGSPVDIQTLMKRMTRERLGRQPVGAACAGSMFKNPPGDHAGRLIEAAGCKGLTVGQAQVSPKHANFFINVGGATAADMEALIAEVARRVEAACGVTLELEIKVVGELAREGEGA